MIQLLNFNNQLTTLKMAFDKAIMQGHSFSEVKKIYIQIKELEKLIAERQLEILKSGKVEE